jgi:hypothetical protein
MTLSLTDLPVDVRQAFEASAAQSEETLKLGKLAAAVDIEAIAVVDGPNGLMYITRDSGQTFKAEGIAKTIHLKGDPNPKEGIAVRRIIRVRHAGT